jgi:hypothetical protein
MRNMLFIRFVITADEMLIGGLWLASKGIKQQKADNSRKKDNKNEDVS